MKKLLLTILLCLIASSAIAEQAASKLLRVVMPSSPRSFDPYYELTEDNSTVGNLFFDSLVRWDMEHGIEFRLAESLERTAPLVWRTTLRKGVLFHSGNKFTAKDVAWSLNRAKQSPEYKAIFNLVERAEIIDEYTVDFHTSKPYNLLPSSLRFLYCMDSQFYSGLDNSGMDKGLIAPETTKSSNASKQTKQMHFAHNNISGTGPFIFDKQTEPQKLHLKRFADHWSKQGNIEHLIIDTVSNDSQRITALLSDNADFISSVPPSDYVQLYGANGINMFTRVSTRIILFQFNISQNKDLQNKAVREAIIAATDSAGIVNKILNKSTIAATQFPQVGMPGYNPEIDPAYNISKAQELLDAAGYGDKHISLKLIAPKHRYIADEKIAMTFAGMMQKIGIYVDLEMIPRALYREKLKERQADLAMIGWHPDTEDTANYFEYLLMCPDSKLGFGAYNFGQYCNPELDNAIIKSEDELDPDKRSAHLLQAVNIANQDAAFIPLHYEPYSWAASKRVLNAGDVVNKSNNVYFGDIVIEDID